MKFALVQVTDWLYMFALTTATTWFEYSFELFDLSFISIPFFNENCTRWELIYANSIQKDSYPLFNFLLPFTIHTEVDVVLSVPCRILRWEREKNDARESRHNKQISVGVFMLIPLYALLCGSRLHSSIVGSQVVRNCLLFLLGYINRFAIWKTFGGNHH